MEREVIETRTAKIWLEADGIVREVFVADAEITVKDIRDNTDAIIAASQGRKRPVLFDGRAIVNTPNREVREYSASDKVADGWSAMAFLVGSPITKLMGNFFMTVNRPVFPCRLFTSESEALAWLKRFLE